jgi:hypothetical protein
MDNWLNAKNKPNQTQFKPNPANDPKYLYYGTLHKKTALRRIKNKPKTNPTPKTSINIYNTKAYIKNTALRPIRANPKQTQSDRLDV